MHLSMYALNINTACHFQCAVDCYNNHRKSSAVLIRVPNPAHLMKTDHTSYHGELIGIVAEQKLRSQGGHCYLTRYSKSRSAYALSVHLVRGPGSVIISHFRIMVDGDDIWLDQEVGHIKFDTLGCLLHHYQRNPLNHELPSIGEECRMA